MHLRIFLNFTLVRVEERERRAGLSVDLQRAGEVLAATDHLLQRAGQPRGDTVRSGPGTGLHVQVQCTLYNEHTLFNICVHFIVKVHTLYL